MNKRNFVWLGEWTDLTADFTPEQLGTLLRMVQHHVDGQDDKPTKDKEVTMAYRFIVGAVDRSMEKYEEICNKRADAARKKADKQKQANANKSMQMQANGGINIPNPNPIPNPIPNNNPNPIPHKGGKSDAPARVGAEYFGQFKNVELLPQEHRTLVETYGEQLTNETIEDLSSKLAEGSVATIYHYATLDRWLRRAKQRKADEDALTPTFTPIQWD